MLECDFSQLSIEVSSRHSTYTFSINTSISTYRQILLSHISNRLWMLTAPTWFTLDSFPILFHLIKYIQTYTYICIYVCIYMYIYNHIKPSLFHTNATVTRSLLYHACKKKIFAMDAIWSLLFIPLNDVRKYLQSVSVKQYLYKSSRFEVTFW